MATCGKYLIIVDIKKDTEYKEFKKSYKEYFKDAEDAIKELPNLPLPFETWKAEGINMISFANVKQYL